MLFRSPSDGRTSAECTFEGVKSVTIIVNKTIQLTMSLCARSWVMSGVQAALREVANHFSFIEGQVAVIGDGRQLTAQRPRYHPPQKHQTHKERGHGGGPAPASEEPCCYYHSSEEEPRRGGTKQFCFSAMGPSMCVPCRAARDRTPATKYHQRSAKVQQLTVKSPLCRLCQHTLVRVVRGGAALLPSPCLLYSSSPEGAGEQDRSPGL